jgi:hydrogenase-4 membrane subunit HyfE
MQALQQIPWVPVLVSAVAFFILGALWYTLLFSKPWVASRRYSDEQMAEMKKVGMGKSLVWNFLANFVTCAAFSILVSHLNLHSAAQGARLGVLVGVGFAAMILLVQNLYSIVRFSGFLIDAAYQIVAFVMIGLILGGWR